MPSTTSQGRFGRRAAAWRVRAVVLATVAVFASAVAVAVEADKLAPDTIGSHRAGPSSSQLSAQAPAPGISVGDVPAGAGTRVPRSEAVAKVTAAHGVPIPRSYLGLSIETWDLLLFDQRPGVFERVLRLLTVRGDGPLVLRLGGNSADRSWWQATPGPGERFPFLVSPHWFHALRAVTAADHLRLLLDLNLVANDPAMASAFVATARATLPPGSIEAFEVGNEPDLYQRGWFERMATLVNRRAGVAASWRRYLGSLYASEFRRYAGALGGLVATIEHPTVATAQSHWTTAAGGPVPLAGPELANPVRDLGYMPLLLAADRRNVRLLTAHSYRYSECSTPNQSVFPTIHRILSLAASARVAASLEPLVRLASRARLPLRLTELNSVSCGGRPGVSDTFATALWAPDALFALLHAGVAGVNIHVRENRLNQAFAITPRGLRARPLLYGLLAFARTLDNGTELLPMSLREPRRDNIRVWAVRTAAGGLHVLALNKGPRSVWLTVREGLRGPASVVWLTAPRVRSKRGVKLGGQWLNAAGQWVGRPLATVLSSTPDGIRMHLRAYSGALLSIAPPAGGPS